MFHITIHINFHNVDINNYSITRTFPVSQLKDHRESKMKTAEKMYLCIKMRNKSWSRKFCRIVLSECVFYMNYSTRPNIWHLDIFESSEPTRC